jgi:REP element-mobilizing transposase RayT
MYNSPLAYFITFRTYGTWLHGDQQGSVDRRHNAFGTPMLAADQRREEFERSKLKHPPVVLNEKQRCLVYDALTEVCGYRGWALHALNVRSNHVHIVVSCDVSPERAMNDFKAYATRRLRESSLIEAETKVWSRHGSTIYIFKAEKLAEKIRYVQDFQ